MGIGGGSYGGYMTNWVIGQTDRFAAAVAMRPIANLVSEYAQHDIVIWGSLELGPPPWPDSEDLWRRSPIRYVQDIKTPLLLTCGEMDLRCAISQSEEMFGAMRLLGKTVELVRFPEESHDLSRSGRPDRRVERLRRIGGWFERFLGTAAVERPVKASAEVVEAAVQPAAIEAQPIEAVVQPVDVEAKPVEVEADTQLLATRNLGVIPVEEDAALAQPGAAAGVVEPGIVDSEAAADAVVLAPEVEGAAVEPVPASEPEPGPESAAVAREPEPAPVVEPERVPTVADLWQATVPEPAVAPDEWKATIPPPVEPAIEELAPVFPEPEPPFPAPQVVPAPHAGEPEPVATVAEAEPPHVDATQAEPQPAEVSASAPPPPDQGHVAQTVIAWPRGTSPDTPSNGPAQSGFSEEATSIIPAWQPSDSLPESKRTVSLQAVPPEVIAAGRGYPAKLTFESGPFAGRIVALPDQMVTFGRAPDNDVVVGDPATSGRHGRIEVRGGAFWISDLGSTNGTLVNGEPVIERQLGHGDLIAIGQNTIRFTLE
jgi:prolyl oligopeptidase family protein/FHA domain-containing protein